MYKATFQSGAKKQLRGEFLNILGVNTLDRVGHKISRPLFCLRAENKTDLAESYNCQAGMSPKKHLLNNFAGFPKNGVFWETFFLPFS